MPTQNLNIATEGALSSTGTISQDWFGAIQTGFHKIEGFDLAAKDIGIGMVRWPGGYLSETRPDVYGLDKPGLFDASNLWRASPNIDRPDLEDSLSFAVENEMNFSFIVPTGRYADDLELGEQHLKSFLEDLFVGEFGKLPNQLTIEIGNEYASLKEFAGNPEAYGKVASRFAEIIQESADLYLPDAELEGIKIGVQMGISPADNLAIIEQFSPDALVATNSMIFHSLPISLTNLNRSIPGGEGTSQYEGIESLFDDWRAAIESAGGTSDPDLFMSAWTVGGSSNSPEGIDLFFHDYGLKGASVVLETFAGYSSIGVDAAAVWGVDVNNLNSVTSTQSGELHLSHVGELFKSLSETLPGLTYHGEFEPHSRGDDVMTYSFGNDDTIAAYVVVNELDDSENIVSVSFGNETNFKLISASMLSTRLEDGYNGSLDDIEARIHEVPVTYDLGNILSRDGVDIDFNLDFEVAEVTVEIGHGLDASMGIDWISGTSDSDRIRGLADDDFLQGQGGNDILSGHRGNDTLYGGNEDDYLYGNEGNDFLDGEDGRDQLVGGHGMDTLFGGAGNDTLSGHADDDILEGGDGHDIVYGNRGNDSLAGGAGRDRLVGGEGFDTMTGGADADQFCFVNGTDGGVIRDFQVGVDRIELDGIFENTDAFSYISSVSEKVFSKTGFHGKPALKLELSEIDGDTVVRIFGGNSSDDVSIRLEGVAVSDVEEKFSSVFHVGEGFSETGPQAMHTSLPTAGAGGVNIPTSMQGNTHESSKPVAKSSEEGINEKGASLERVSAKASQDTSTESVDPVDQSVKAWNFNGEKSESATDYSKVDIASDEVTDSSWAKKLASFFGLESNSSGLAAGDRERGWFDFAEDGGSSEITRYDTIMPHFNDDTDMPEYENVSLAHEFSLSFCQAIDEIVAAALPV